MSISGPSSAFDSETFGQDASFHLDQPIGSLTISPSGRDVALASKEGLHIIDLDSPYSPPRHLPLRTSWEVADVQWSPFASRDYWVVSTSNQKALVWNLDAKHWQDSIQHVLHGHRRAITDINFSAHNPDVLATCAVDSFVHSWDLRASGRPAISFSDWFAAATSVKWSRQDEHVLASAHDKYLHIWDNRKGAIPLRTIEAHNTRIYGVDWNRFQRNKIVTCSLDRTIKFWNVDDTEDVPERVIETAFPVWRARHTPFGWGMMAMPQRGSSSLHLYDRRPIDGHLENGQVRPVATFGGHHGQIKEFLWRARGGFADGVDQREFQLISWGADRELRLHRIEPESLENVGYEKGVSTSENLNYTRKGARYVTFRDLPDEEISPTGTPHRGESSLPSHHSLSAFRKRNSTTVGMNKVPVAQIKGWVSSQQRSARIAMHGKTSAVADANPIAWLKNVKISSWDPDALAEEIRHVGEKFKRVRFEAVDIKHRKLVMSLQAPWADHQDAVYLRVDIRFPQSYPRHASAIIALQKTSALPEELHSTLASELHTIAEVHTTQQRGCLEALLRYLLREQTLEQVIAYARGDSLIESKLLGPPAEAEESSDSDDDQIAGLGAAVASSANIRVPLAKGCGAVWSETGKLVCFFPPKPKEPASVLAGLQLHGLDRSETGRLFEGFGKFHVDSPVRRATDKTRTTDENDSDSDTSGSLLSSVSSSSSSESEADLPTTYAPYHKRLMAFPQRTKSIDYSNRSTTLAGARPAAADDARQTIVSIRSYDDLVPSSKTLAEGYMIIGDGPDLCKHNATIAEACGRTDLSSVWTLASMILDRTVPLQDVKIVKPHKTDIVLVAREAVSRLRRRDSGVDLSHDDTHSRGAVRWGDSPFASHYLIPAMFDYFERVADIQMLAMLSCAFAEPMSGSQLQMSASAQTPTYFPNSTVAEAFLNPPPLLTEWIALPSIQSRAANKAALSLDDPTTLRLRRGTTMSLDPTAASFRPGQEYRRTYSSAHEERYSANVSLSTSPDGGRAIYRTPTNSAAQASLSAITQSYSHSPPTQPSSGSNVASSLKRYSPSTSLTPGWGIWTAGHGSRATRASIHYSESLGQDKEMSLRSSASMANLRSLRRSGHTTPEVTRREVRSIAPSESSETTRKGKRRSVKTLLRNQDQFDIDSYANTPFLEQNYAWKYAAFRSAYASMLEAWCLPVQRAEMLRMNIAADSANQSTTSSPTKQLRAKSVAIQEHCTRQDLRPRRCCTRCGNTLVPIEKNLVAIGWECRNPSCSSSTPRPSKRSLCSVCHRTAQLATSCLECGHSACTDCRKVWYGRHHQRVKRPARPSVSTVGTAEGSVVDQSLQEVPSKQISKTLPSCPTGCGCHCPTLSPAQIHVPKPAIDTPTNTVPHTSTSDRIGLVPPRMMRTDSQVSAISVNSQRIAAKKSGSSSEGGGGGGHEVPPSSQTATTAAALGPESALDALFHLTGVRSRAGSKAESGAGGGSDMGPGRRRMGNASASQPSGVSNGGTRHISRGSSDVTAAQYHGPSSSNATNMLMEVNDNGHGTRRRQQQQDEGSSDQAQAAALDPWANSRFAGLGKGIGGGLSRGLSLASASASTLRERGSEDTIRGGK